jgi:hypothetical protein
MQRPTSPNVSQKMKQGHFQRTLPTAPVKIAQQQRSSLWSAEKMAFGIDIPSTETCLAVRKNQEKT